MATASPERIWFDGWELTQGGSVSRGWEIRDGMDGVAGMMGSNLDVANRSGEVWVPKQLGAGKFTVQVWLGGKTRSEAQNAWRQLLRACYRPHRLVRVQRQMFDGETVYANAEVVGTIEPNHIGMLGFRAAVTFNVPDGVWLSTSVYAHETAPSARMPHNLYLDKFEPSTAPLELLEYTVFGRITNPKLMDTTDGGYGDTLTYNGTIPSGAWIRFYSANWSMASGGVAYNHALLNPTGRRYLTLSAARPGDKPSVRLTGTNTDSKTKLRVYGRRAYLC